MRKGTGLIEQARRLLAGLEPGQSVKIPITGKQPGNRIGYQALSHAAHHAWGPGMYSLKSHRNPPSVEVTRLAEKRAQGQRRRTNLGPVSGSGYAVLDDWGAFCRRYQEFLREDVSS